jgi:hypothetical protein
VLKLAFQEEEKRYKCFWTNDLETLKNQREYLRKELNTLVK